MEPANTSTLAGLRPGASGTVKAVHSTGLERRRMMDLGIVPGTVIRAEAESPLGDPVAYRIRGALIALRREQAERIELVTDDTSKGDAPS